ncbi:hypothetical protein DRQ25_11095 [Candidatus Fermentibacteria bacterium]|nr:MAG: hypothetical protein DRQ25_11095 [Candidatus Fermentibacteria bacterium]
MVWPNRKNINTLEKEKFVECPAGQTAVRVKQCQDQVFRPSGLTVEGKITIVTISDSGWTALPGTALTDRNAISIQNPTETEIKINFDNTVGTYEGIIISGGGERFYNITDSILIYARSSSGSIDLAIEEVA